jgi:hypothetical protein
MWLFLLITGVAFAAAGCRKLEKYVLKQQI